MFQALGLKPKRQDPSGLAEEGCSRNSSTTQLPTDEAQRPRSEFGDEPPGTPNTLVQYPSNIANQQLPPLSDVEEADLKQYNRFSPWRKVSIVSIISYCAFLAPISSTAILIAVPEVGKTFGTNEDIINASNALYLAFMGISSTFWGPVSQVWGRRPVSIFQKQSAIVSLTDCSFCNVTDFHHQRYSLLCLYDCDNSVSKSSSLFRFPGLHCLSRDIFPCCR